MAGRFCNSAAGKLPDVAQIRIHRARGEQSAPASGDGKPHMFILKLIASIIFNVAIFAVPLFLPAPTLDWWRAWLLLGVVFIGTVGSVVSLSRDHEDLLKERLKPPIRRTVPEARTERLRRLYAEGAVQADPVSLVSEGFPSSGISSMPRRRIRPHVILSPPFLLADEESLQFLCMASE
jgi:hypothetical protein